MTVHPWFRRLRSTDTIEEYDAAMKGMEEGAARMRLHTQRMRRSSYYMRARRLARTRALESG